MYVDYVECSSGVQRGVVYVCSCGAPLRWRSRCVEGDAGEQYFSRRRRRSAKQRVTLPVEEEWL